MIKDRKILCKDTVENICKTIKGKVYETEINFNEWAEFSGS